MLARRDQEIPVFGAASSSENFVAKVKIHPPEPIRVAAVNGRKPDRKNHSLREG